MKPGERYKVKSTPWTRRHGVRTHGAWQAKGDDRAWPGEIGTVVERKWTAWNGDPMAGLWLEFERGRSIRIDSDGACREAEDLIKVRAP